MSIMNKQYCKFSTAMFVAVVLAGFPAIMHIVYPLQPALAQKTVNTTVNGAGATFPFPLIDTWRKEYQKVNPTANINYQSIGSGGGIKQFTEKTVDFGASDAPLSPSEMARAPNTVHIPETTGSIVVSYNLPSIPQKGLKLSGPILADIFLGKIQSWNDPQIVSLNPDVHLPDASILVVHRSDGSGTTFVWTGYLSKVSPEWKQEVGSGKSVEWPNGVGAPGNEGVATAIKGTPYSIGYVELSYALSTKMPYAFLQNKEGYFIEPSFNSIKAAVSSSTSSLPKGDESWSNVSISNADGKNSYPIASFSYLLLYRELGNNPSIDEEKAKTIFEFISWAITDGQQYSANLGYVPLPDEVVKIDQETLQSLTFRGQPILSIVQPPSSSPQGLALLLSNLSNNSYLVVSAAVGIAASGIIIALWRAKSRKQARALPSESIRQQQSPGEKDASVGRAQYLTRKKAISGILNRRTPFGDRVFRGIVIGAAGYTAFLMILVAYSVFAGSAEAFSREGIIGFITGTDWNAVEGRESYGALPYIIGTLASAGIAMAIGVPISIGIAMFVSEIAPRRIAMPLSFVIELLAAVPSIIYGLWAIFVFRFWVRDLLEIPLHQLFGDTLSAFAKTPFGLDIFTAGVVLAVMIIPTVSSVAREVMRAVPNSQREAAYSLGATKWETVKTAVFPSARSGLLGGSILGLGRAVGETMLVTMVIGNAIGLAAIPTSPFSPSQTLASLIANEFNEAVTSFQTSALIALGAVLFLLTIAINIGARFMVSRISTQGLTGKTPDNMTNTPRLQQSNPRQSSMVEWYHTQSASRMRLSSHLHEKDNTSIRSRAQTQQVLRSLLRTESSKRKIVNASITIGALLCVVAAIIPLGSILIEVVKNGAAAISLEFLSQAPGALGSGEGGIKPAIQGTLIVAGLASAIGVPVGVMAGIYLSEYSGTRRSSRIAHSIRFFNDVLTGLPSIVIGIVGYVTIVLTTGSFSAGAGAFALSIIMIPVVVRVTEETLKLVPNSIREAAHSLGIPGWRIVLFIVLPTAKSGVLTGVVLALSRIMGETAPLIMTILGTSLFFTSFVGPVDALPLRIWRLASQPYESAHSFGWGAALVLILIVFALSVGLRLASRRRGGHSVASSATL